MKRLIVWTGVVMAVAFSEDLQEAFKKRSLAAEQTGLKEPFRGVTANGTP